MTTLLALLAGVRESPEEDAPRLVLADWLEEFGDEAQVARANLIRLQCAAERLDRPDSRRQEAEECANQPIQQYPLTWCRPFLDDESVTFATFADDLRALLGSPSLHSLEREPLEVGELYRGKGPIVGMVQRRATTLGTLRRV